MILVARSGKARIHSDPAGPRARRRAALLLAFGMLACVGFGAFAALTVASPRQRTLDRIVALDAQVHQQQNQLDTVRASAQRDMDAMAVKLGELQAQSIRLDALGERLAAAGHLDGGEFDFDRAPAVGGPERSVAPASLPLSLDASMEALRARFDDQQTQLGVLEGLLLDRQVDARTKPTGMPVADGYIASYFGVRLDPFDGRRAFHPGLDIDAPRGTAVHAVAEGVVTYAGVRSGYGNVVEIDHGDGYMTRYAHNSKLLVRVGQRVHAGDAIADVGSTGRSTGPHLHFEVWYEGRAVNPLAYVRAHRG